MADSTISGLTNAGTLDGTERVPVVQGASTVDCTTQDIADLAGGGGGVLAEGTFTASTAVNVEDFAGGGYDHVRIVFDVQPSSVDDVFPLIRFKLNGSYKSDATYRYNVFGRASSGGSDEAASNAATAIRATPDAAAWGLSTDAGTGDIITIDIYNCSSTTKVKCLVVERIGQGTTGSMLYSRGGGTYDGTDKLSVLAGVQLVGSAGEALTGSYKVYAD